jgi:hypothetical protein
VIVTEIETEIVTETEIGSTTGGGTTALVG